MSKNTIDISKTIKILKDNETNIPIISDTDKSINTTIDTTITNTSSQNITPCSPLAISPVNSINNSINTAINNNYPTNITPNNIDSSNNRLTFDKYSQDKNNQDKSIKHMNNWCKAEYELPKINTEDIKLNKRQLITDFIGGIPRSSRYSTRAHRLDYKICYNIYKTNRSVNEQRINKSIINNELLDEDTITCVSFMKEVMRDFFLITKLSLDMFDNVEQELFDENSQLWDILEKSDTFNLSIFTQMNNIYSEMRVRLAIMNNLHIAIKKHKKNIDEYTKLMNEIVYKRQNQLIDIKLLDEINLFTSQQQKYTSILRLTFVNINDTKITISSYNNFTTPYLSNSYKIDIDKYNEAIKFLTEYGTSTINFLKDFNNNQNYY